MAVSDDTHPGGAVQKPRGVNDDNPPTNIALPHDGLSYRFPFHTEKRTYLYFDPIAQKAFDANYSGEEDVNGLTAYRFTQNVGYPYQRAPAASHAPKAENAMASRGTPSTRGPRSYARGSGL